MNLDHATSDERAYLAGVAKDTSSPSYKFNRAAMVQEIHERHVRHEAMVPALRAERAELLQRLDRQPHDVALHGAHLVVLAKLENFQIQPIGQTDVAGYACGRTAFIPWPLRTLDDVHTGYHEAGHILSGRCPRTEPHRRDTRERDWWHCLACEVAANEKALRLAPFTKELQTHLARSMRGYRQGTPAAVPVQKAADRVISGTAWREDLHRRMQHERLRDMAADMRRWGDEAAAPRPLTRREQQWQDIQRWGQEVGR